MITPNFKPAPGSGRRAMKERRKTREGVKARADRKAKLDAVAAYRKLRRACYDRDKGKCRVCLNAVTFDTGDVFTDAHAHHVLYRSAGGPDESWNLATVCHRCHDAEHAHKVRIEGNADQKLTVTFYDKHYQVLDVRQV